MRIDLDAEVRTRDRQPAGSIQRVVFDPRRNEVTHVVLGTGGLLGREVLVPREELQRATAEGDSLRLHLTRDDLEGLPPYVPSAYVVPPAAWVPPYGYGLAAPAYVWPAVHPAPRRLDAPPPARDAADSPPTLVEGAAVVDRHGEDVGAVHAVRLDPSSGELRGFVLRLGGTLRTLLGGGDAVEVGAAQVDRFDEQAVYLRLSRDELQRLVRAG
jgi:sporulation protein YlmC with PRC-barrel domain